MFLGFDADASLNIAARIRGPNVSSYLSFPLALCLNCKFKFGSFGCVFHMINISKSLLCLSVSVGLFFGPEFYYLCVITQCSLLNQT